MAAPALSNLLALQAAEAYKRLGTQGYTLIQGLTAGAFDSRLDTALGRGFLTRADRRTVGAGVPMPSEEAMMAWLVERGLEQPPQPKPQPVPQAVPSKPAFDLAMLRDALRKTPMTADAVAERFGISRSRAEVALEDLQAQGLDVAEFGGLYSIGKARPAPRHERGLAIPEYRSRPDGTYLFGFTSDNHLGSKYSRLDVLEGLYDEFAKQGVDRVFNAGNWIDGESRFNMHDLLVHGMDAQCRYLAEHYPKRPGIVTYAVAGDDHEGWYCFEMGAEILTMERGWVGFDRLTGGEHVATRTRAGVFEWQVPSKVIRKPHRGEMIRLRHRSIDVAVTPDHRFEVEVKASMHAQPVTRVMTAREIADSFKPRCLGIPRSTKAWNGLDVRLVEIPRQPCRYDNHPRIWHPGTVDAHNLAVVCAWYVTEGWTDNNLIGIGQAAGINDENRALILNAIKRLGGNPGSDARRITVSSADLAAWLREHCGSGFEAKKLPRWVLDMPPATLEAVFDAMVRGDGHDRGDGRGWKFYSASTTLQAQMGELAQKLGLTVSYAQGKGCANVHVGEAHQTAYLFERPTVEQYEGDVFCVSVPNERIFVRKNGKTLWSMNCQREGVDIGRYAQNVMREAGRQDWVDLGYMEAYVRLVNAQSGESTMLHLMHPGGGSAYAVSYTVQKIVEGYDGGDKPAVLLAGHYHKMAYNMVRNVHAIQTGTTEDQTPFMRKKKLAAHVGGGICQLRQDPKTGAITACRPEFFPYFVRSFYNQRWSMSGDVQLADRMAAA